MRLLSTARRSVLIALAAVSTLACGPPPPVPPASPLAAEIDAATARGSGLLLARQSEDGAWRSEVYGAFKRGDALTPLALRALSALPASSVPVAGLDLAVERGAAYLANMVLSRNAMARPSGVGATPASPQFAVYTASQAVEVLSHRSGRRHRAARDAWVAELRGRQLIEDLGWSEGEAPYGGWGYSMTVPRKPPPGTFQPPLLGANTSATVFALQGLRAAGLSADDRICRRALKFLDSMQNYADPPFDDGGFHFIYDDPVRNKAGAAGSGDGGRVRFRSYGSTTADGLRGLLLCGRTLEHPRARAAFGWLEEHFTSSQHPGDFAPRLAADRDGLYYYWVASVAQTLRLAGIGPELTPAARPPVPWAEDLARELIARQGKYGGWANPVVTMREDEPIIATSMALLALSAVRQEIP